MDEYMSPEDRQALIEFAGPLYAQAKFVDANSIDKDGYQTSRSALEIQSALERDFNRSPARPPQHNVIDYGQYQAPPQIIPQVQPQPYYPPVDSGQLEFTFDQSEQQKTNVLLEEISRKLTKLISVIQEKDKPQSNVTKLKVEKDDVPKVSGRFSENK